jgi:GH35 family endo-1,4-beta-xylanase
MTIPWPALAQNASSLAELAAAKNIRFGSAIGGRNFADLQYRALNAAQCALIVPENEMKWSVTRPDARHFDFRELLVTEMDVHDNPLPRATGPRDARVAAHSKAYLDLMLSYPQTKTIVCWGLSDRYSWLNDFRPRPDGTPKRPCPFDVNFKQKLFHHALAAAFAAAPERS